MIKIKRVYDKPSKDDGCRILVDRLWPRGLSKDRAKIDLWLKEIAPSGELREWFSHEPSKWEEFKKRYRRELRPKKDLLDRIRSLEKERGVVTLVYSSTEETYNNAVALCSQLEG
jgi:uncharacterized protein YeaO (DUF488 family)